MNKQTEEWKKEYCRNWMHKSYHRKSLESYTKYLQKKYNVIVFCKATNENIYKSSTR